MNLADTKKNFSPRKYLPFLDWLANYRREDLSGDLLAGVIVAVMLVPQGMAYALLAGLPPQAGLYAGIVPILLYGLLGTSRTLAVGPVALTSLLVAAGVGQFAPQESSLYLLLALTVAFLVGLIQFGMGLLRLGSLVNFISHPVLSGFTSAAAILIAFSQIEPLLGISFPNSENIFENLALSIQYLPAAKSATLIIGLIGIAILVYFKLGLSKHLESLGVPAGWREPIARSGPLVVVALGTIAIWALGLHQTAGVDVVGEIPAGLPPLTRPAFDLARWQELLPVVLTISVVAFLESISVAKSLAGRRREKVNANQELIALGFANLGAAFTGGYPVAGGFSRSVVNFTVGARTGLASIVTALLVALTLIFLTPLFYYLPKAVLAAIIVVAVANLIDLKAFRYTWRYNKSDAFSLGSTFFAVLVMGIETGILVGVIVTLVLYLRKTSRPHVAIVGRLGESEHYRNIHRHPVQTCPHVLAMRIDESLYFANAQYLETLLLDTIADQPQVDHLVLICSAVNSIDTSALETLEELGREVREAGVDLYLAEIKGPVMDRLQRIGFIERFGSDRVFLSTHAAMQALRCSGN